MKPRERNVHKHTHFAFHKHDSAMQLTWLFECSQLLLYRNPCEIIRKDYLSILRKREVNGGETSGCFVIIVSKKEQTPKQNHLFFQDSSQKGHQCLSTGQEEPNFTSAPVLSIPPSPMLFLPADHLALGNTLSFHLLLFSSEEKTEGQMVRWRGCKNRSRKNKQSGQQRWQLSTVYQHWINKKK